MTISFAAASNVCGVLLDVDRITAVLHKYGALSFWDYSCAAPYVDISMRDKDAVFISSHRMVGGVGGVGILCAKQRLFEFRRSAASPVVAGNGTLFFAVGVQEGEYRYLDNIEEREEGGTGNILGAVRSAIAFMIKDQIGTEFIRLKHEYNLQFFMDQCGDIKNLKLLGYTRESAIDNRLPVVSFEIKHKNKLGRPLCAMVAFEASSQFLFLIHFVFLNL